MPLPKASRITVLAGASLLVLAAVLALRHRIGEEDVQIPSNPGSNSISRPGAGAAPGIKAGLPSKTDGPKTPAEVKKRVQSLDRDQLLAIVDDKELFASLDQFLQGDLLARLAFLDPLVTVQRGLDGTIPEAALKGTRLNPNFVENNKEYASGLLKTLDPKDSLQKLIFSKVYAAGMEGAPSILVESLLTRSKENTEPQMLSGYRTALMHLYSVDPAKALSVVTATAAEGSKERFGSLFFLGQEISKNPESESALSLNSISNKDLEAVTAGKTVELLRAGNASGLELLETMPNESLLSVISQQPSVAGLCKINPQAAVDLISRIEMPADRKSAVEVAAYTLVRLSNQALVLDWIAQQPDSEKKFAVLRGSIKRLEEVSAPDVEDWKRLLPDTPPPGSGAPNSGHE